MPETPRNQSRARRLWSGDPSEWGRSESEAAPLPPRREEPPLDHPAARSAGRDSNRRRPRRRRRGARAAAALAALAVLLGGGLLARELIVDDEVGQAAVPALPAASGGDIEPTRIGRVFKAASPAVAAVQSGGGSGTGFLVGAEGTLVTNAHVVASSSEVRVRFGEEGRILNAQVAGRDEGSDLAVLRVSRDDVRSIRPLALADSDRVEVGDFTIAIGNPLGLERTATSGIVSAVDRSISAPDGFAIEEVIQTDAAINPGNSGGPLLDARGRVIGVNSQIATTGAQGSIGIGFAVPANTVRDIVPRLSRGATIERPWLGLTSTDAPGGGAAVAETQPGSPAAQAGLRAGGDVIVEVDGERIAEPDDISSAITDDEPGDRIQIRVRRDGQTRGIEVTLGTRPANAQTGTSQGAAPGAPPLPGQGQTP